MSAAANSHALPGIFGAMAPLLNHYGLLAVALLVFLEDFGVPVPGETVLIAAAIYAGAGKLNIVAVGVIGFVAAVVGDNVGYAIGRFGGRALALRYGRYVFLTGERLDKAEAFVNRHGGKVITVARFIEGLRQANGIVAGIARLHWLRFLAFNALGAALWTAVWVTIGYVGGQHITAIYAQFQRYVVYVVIAAVVVIATLAVWHLRKRRRGRGDGGGGTAAVPAAGGDRELSGGTGHQTRPSPDEGRPGSVTPGGQDHESGGPPSRAANREPGTRSPDEDDPAVARGAGIEDDGSGAGEPGPAHYQPHAREPGGHADSAGRPDSGHSPGSPDTS